MSKVLYTTSKLNNDIQHFGLLSKMESLGKVEEITCDGRIIVECRDLPDIGCTVFDNNRQRIGVVRKVFGPVDGPYASVSPDGKLPLEKLRGKELFYNRGKEQNGKTKRRNRRN